MVLGIVVLLIFFIVIGVVGWLCYKQITKNSLSFHSSKDAERTTKGLLPFEDIHNGIIDLGNFKYRLILECSSINYHLRSPEEQDIIEMAYMRFLHNRNFPIVIYIATRKFNFSKIKQHFKKQSQKTIEEYGYHTESPLGRLAGNHMDFLNFLENSQSNMQQKRKYMIIPYDLDEKEVSKLTETEKRDFAFTQIVNRANMIKDDLAALKIETKLLNTREVVEVIYSALNNQNSELAETVGMETYQSIFVDSQEIGTFQEFSSLELAGLALTEAINKLSSHAKSSLKTEEIVTQLEKIKNEII